MTTRSLSQEKPPIPSTGNTLEERLRRIRAARKAPSTKAKIFLPLDRELYSKLVAKAAAEGVRPGELIRSVIEDYVDRECRR